MDNISIQVARLTSGSVLMNNNVIYDSTIESEGNISYNTGTGLVTLSETGKYAAYWWIATQTGQSTNGMAFDLVTSQGDQIAGNSPIKSDEVTGFGIINIDAAPVTLSIQNTSNNTIYYSTSVDTKASLMIFRIPEVPVISTVAYGGLSDSLIAPFNLDPGETVQVSIADEMVSENLVYGTNSITITVAGNYQVYYMINFVNAGSGITVQPDVRVNGTTNITELSQAANLGNTSSSIISASAIVTLNAGDVVELYLTSATGGIISLVPDTNVILTVNKVSSN